MKNGSLEVNKIQVWKIIQFWVGHDRMRCKRCMLTKAEECYASSSTKYEYGS